MAIRKILLSTMCGLCVRVTLVVTFRVDFEGEFWGDFEDDFEDNFVELLTLYVMILWLRLRCWDIYIILLSVWTLCKGDFEGNFESNFDVDFEELI